MPATIPTEHKETTAQSVAPLQSTSTPMQQQEPTAKSAEPSSSGPQILITPDLFNKYAQFIQFMEQSNAAQSASTQSGQSSSSADADADYDPYGGPLSQDPFDI